MIWLLAIFALAQNSHASNLTEFLQAAWTNSGQAHVEQRRGEAIEEQVSSVRGKYFPHLSAQAIDTDGFPASNSGLHSGGIVGSPYRKGWAYGLILEQTVYDFGRISAALEQSHAEGDLEQARMAAEKLRFLSKIGELYLSCARTHSLEGVNARLMEWAILLRNETRKYAKTGQRSIVDRALIQTEVSELELQKRELTAFEASLKEQMSLYAPDNTCASLSKVWNTQIPSSLRVPEPSVLLAQANLNIAQSRVKAASSAQLPTLNVTGSVGDMEDVRLVQKKDYAVGVGLTVPLWNGGEDYHRKEAAKSLASAQSEELKVIELEVRRHLLDLKAKFTRDKELLEGIEKNLEQIRETVKTAVHRYQRLEGPLIDVRDSFRQLQSAESKRIEVMTGLAVADLELALLKP